MSHVSVTDTVEREALVVALAGDLDIRTAPAYAIKLHDVISARTPECRFVVLDLRRIDFCGVAGLCMLMQFADACTDEGQQLCVLAGANVAVRRILGRTELGVHLPIANDLGEALARLRRAGQDRVPYLVRESSRRPARASTT
jgi:anti-anti-sigma factor